MSDRQDAAAAAALARLYDLDFQDDPGDLDLYLALADRVDGMVLELAAGTGRLAVPLAAAGHPLTAVDIDPTMVARGRSRAYEAGLAEDRVRFVEADLLGLRLPDAGRYAMAFIALNSIMLLDSRAAQRDAVATLAAHLAPGGLAVVDVWLPDADDLARFDGRVILEWPRTDPESGHLVTKAGSAQHDAASGTVALTTVYEVGPQGAPPVRWVRHDRLRLLGADELAAFAEDAGLRVELVAGGYDLEPLGPGSERAVLVARKP
ncbi:MAG: class I SAM-dependent methyltransferase [Chloroflexota bacterium]